MLQEYGHAIATSMFIAVPLRSRTRSRRSSSLSVLGVRYCSSWHGRCSSCLVYWYSHLTRVSCLSTMSPPVWHVDAWTVCLSSGLLHLVPPFFGWWLQWVGGIGLFFVLGYDIPNRLRVDVM